MNSWQDDHSSPIPGPSSIPLYLVNGVATVWDAQVAATLHCVHNISGLRTGTLPGVSQQNAFLGLPVTLMAEETAYLLQEGIAHLIPLNPSPTVPSDELVKTHTEARICRYRAIEESARLTEEKRKLESKKAFDKGGEVARIKREARARVKAEKAATSSSSTSGQLFSVDDDQSGSTKSTLIVHDEPLSDMTPNSTISATTTTTTHFHPIPSHPLFPATPPYDQHIITHLPHPLFQFPTDKRQRALLKTFTTLLKRGYRMGLGPRFGGEYLVYPGDYLRYHAHFTSQVILAEESIRPSEIVAWGRLGTGTKKAGLLCCVGDDDGDMEDGVEFYSLEWANFG